MSHQRSRSPAGLLRFSGRALEAATDNECYRTRVRNGPRRTVRTMRCLSNETALPLIFKLAEAAEKSWRCLDGPAPETCS
jgi:hypothetical protein